MTKKMTVMEVAMELEIYDKTVRIGLQQKDFPDMVSQGYTLDEKGININEQK